LATEGLKDQQIIHDLTNKLIAFEREMAQYKIVWNPFFGLDAPLREQILIGKEKLDRFEQQHHVLPPSMKKSKHKIECLSSFGKLPLRLGELPLTDGNKFPRFDLINTFMDKEILLHNCFLKNEKGDIIKLPNCYISPLHSIGFSIGNEKIKHEDILIPQEFCSFKNPDNRLMITDSCNPPHLHRLYPVLVETINSLKNTDRFPIEINALSTKKKMDIVDLSLKIEDKIV